jgi:hypothetical protein
MSNVLSDDKRQQILALGRLGWSLRRIEQATGVRRETASTYLKAAGISVRRAGGWGRRAKPAIQVITDSTPAKQDKSAPETAKPAREVTTDSGPAKESANPAKARTLSHCEPYRDLIELGVQRGRNAMAIWQDLVSEQGFAQGYHSVRRFVNKLHPEVKQARVVIITEPGEEAQVDTVLAPGYASPTASSTGARACLS